MSDGAPDFFAGLSGTPIPTPETRAARAALPPLERLGTWRAHCGGWPIGDAFRELGDTLTAVAGELQQLVDQHKANRS